MQPSLLLDRKVPGEHKFSIFLKLQLLFLRSIERRLLENIEDIEYCVMQGNLMSIRIRYLLSNSISIYMCSYICVA